MRYILIILLTSSIFFAQDLKFFLSIEKETLYVCEEIEARLVVKNLTQEKQIVIKPGLWNYGRDGFDMLIVTQFGDTLSDLFIVSITSPYDKDRYLTLQPGESIDYTLPPGLFYHFSLPLKGSSGKIYQVPGIGLPTGTYKMEVRWKKNVSNVIEFTVKQPKGNLAILYDLYLEAFDRKRDCKDIVEELEKLEKNKDYLLEPYTPMIYDLLIMRLILSKNRSREILDFSKKLIENFPNSKFAYNWLYKGVLRFESKNGFKNYLEYLNEKFPNTLIGNATKQELVKYKKK